MGSSSPLIGRALTAVALLVGFYLLAIAIAAALVYIPYAEWVYAHRLHFKLAFGCIAAAAVILWSIVPRIDRFDAPGPELHPDRHAEMFGAIREVGERAGQELPASVYILPELNAWVAQRGGFMGIGSRRVMGIGLPLLQVTTVSQFKAVLAHEFGHYHGGDTGLGPWIYKTRQAIGRTLNGLGDGSWVRKPFIWYGNLFLRITHAISRRQEYAADRLAARMYGPEAMISGLKTVYGHASLFQSYWYNEVSPVLDAGRRPPIADGFQHFAKAPQMTTAVSASLEEEMKGGDDDPYETHPRLPKRIEALGSMPMGTPAESDPPAISLLRDVPALETEMLSHIAGEEKARELMPIEWSAVGSDVYLPLWERAVGEHAAVFRELTAGTLPGAASDLASFGAKLVEPGEPATSAEQRGQRAAGLLGAALCLALHREGWTLRVLPGEEVAAEKAGTSVTPFTAVNLLANGAMHEKDWRRLCAGAAIADVPLYRPGG